MMDLYFNFLAIYREDFKLCFVNEKSEYLELYKKVHIISDEQFERIKSNTQQKQEVVDNVHEENKEENNKETHENNNTENNENTEEIKGIEENNEVKIQDQNGDIKKEGQNKLKPELSVDLILVEVLNNVIEVEEAKERKEIIEGLLSFYDTMALNLFHYISKTVVIDMEFVNKIAFCAIKSVEWICKERETQENFLPKIVKTKTAYIEFFLSLLSLNLSCLGDTKAHIQVKLSQNLIEALNQTEKNDRLRGSVDDITTKQLEYDIEAIPDHMLNNKIALVDMFTDLVLDYTSILWPAALSLRKLDEPNTAEKKLNMELDNLAGAILVAMQGVFQITVPKEIRNELIQLNLPNILNLANSMIGMLNSFPCISKASRIMHDITVLREDLEIKELWEKFELASQERPDKSLALAGVLIGILSESNGVLPIRRLSQEDTIMYLEELKKAFGRIRNNRSSGDMNALVVLNKMLVYVSEIEKEELESLQKYILQVMREIYKVPDLFEKLIFSDSLMNRFLKEFHSSPHSTILLDFINALYEKLIQDTELFKSLGTQFFSKIKSFLDYMHKSLTTPLTSTGSVTLLRLHSASSNPGDLGMNSPIVNAEAQHFPGFNSEQIKNFSDMVQLICYLIANLISLEPQVDFMSQYTGKQSETTAFSFKKYIITKKSSELQSYFATTGIYEQMVAFLNLDIFQTREMAYWITLMTFSIIHQEKEIMTAFAELGHHMNFYKVLTNIYKKDRLPLEDVLRILNCLLNIASNNDYFYLFEDRFNGNILDLPSVLNSLDKDEASKTLRYMNIGCEDFIYLIMKVLFEWNLEANVKFCYLKVIKRALQYSYYNAFSCTQGPLVEFLLICLRREKNEGIKLAIAKVLTKILKVSVNVQQFKSLLRTVRFNYHTLYSNFFEKLISPNFRKEFVEDMSDMTSFGQSISLIFEQIINKVLSETEDNDNFIHFSGQNSGIIIKTVSLNTAKSFSILIQFRSENLKSTNKKCIEINDIYNPKAHFAGTVRSSY